MASVIEEFWRQVPEARTEGCYLLLDEVQEMERWRASASASPSTRR